MRRQLWLAILMGTVSFFGTGNSVWSQGGPPSVIQMGPPQGANMSGGLVSDFSGLPPMEGAYPSYYQPYPNISPYEHEFSQIANRGGLWESETQSRMGLPSRWKFRSEYVRMSVERGRDLIGNRNAPIYRDQIRPDLEAAGDGDLDDYLDALSGLNNGGLGFNLFDPRNGRRT